MILKDACSLNKSYDKPRQCIKKQRHCFADKILYSQSYGFSSSHVEMWELPIEKAEHRRRCFRIVVLEKTFENHLIRPLNHKRNQPWIFSGRTFAEVETLILWPPDANSQLIGKDPDAGKDWRQKERGRAEDEMAEWHHQPNGHEFEQTLKDSRGQRSLACCSPWGCKESDMT